MTATPLRVLMVSDVYLPRVNGVSTSISTFRQALARHNVDVRLVAPRYGAEADAVGIVRVPGRPVPGDREDRLAHWRGMHQAAMLEAQSADLVHVQTPFVAHYAGLRAARRCGVPVIATYHTFFEEYLHHYAPLLPAGLMRVIARRFSRSQCNAVDAVVVPSAAMAERLGAYGVTAPMHVLPTGIPLEDFREGNRQAFRAFYGIDPRRPVALYVGRVAHEKNIDFLLEAARAAVRQLPTLLLLIAGEGPALDALRRRVAALGLEANVRFLGYLGRVSELPDCYAAADVFVFASRTETQGLVLLEAMAAGTPVVALSAMGTTDILAPARGSISPADEPAAFAAAMVQVLGDESLRQRLRAEALDYVATWRAETMAARMATLYREMAAARSPALAAPAKARTAAGI